MMSIFGLEFLDEARDPLEEALNLVRDVVEEGGDNLSELGGELLEEGIDADAHVFALLQDLFELFLEGFAEALEGFGHLFGVSNFLPIGPWDSSNGRFQVGGYPCPTPLNL